MPRRRRSHWRDDAVWAERLESDHAFLQESMGDEGMETLAEVLRVTSNDLGAPDYVVVYGSRAREIGQGTESDVDVCLEATWVPDDPDRMPRIRERQNDLVFDLMTFPRGLLLGRLRVHDDVALAIAREGRVYADADAWYRNTLIVADEEGLIES